MIARTEDTDPYCLGDAAAAHLLRSAPWRRFAVVGDSLAAGTGGPSPGYRPLPWGDRVAAALRRVAPDLVYRNTGTIGVTAGRVAQHQVDALVGFAPDLVHVSCGANDLWRPALDLGRLEDDLRAVYEPAARTGAQLTTFTFGRAFDVGTVPDFPDRVRALNEVIRTVADDVGALVVEMWDHPINDRPDLLSADGIHFSASGQAVLAAEVIKALAAVLAVRTA